MRGWFQRPRLLAAFAFGVAGSLLPAAWFLPTIVRTDDPRALLLYVGLPGLAAAAAGAGLGAPLLDRTRTRGPGAAALRGAGIASIALLLFAPLFALTFTWTAPGQTGIVGLTALVLIFSLIGVWWAAALVGALVGLILWRLATSCAQAST
jgi:hypothetical protein